MALRYIAPGIEVDEDSIQSIQEINGATVVKLKDGSVVAAPSRDHAMNLGQAIIFEVLAKRLNEKPSLKLAKPYGLAPVDRLQREASEKSPGFDPLW